MLRRKKSFIAMLIMSTIVSVSLIVGSATVYAGAITSGEAYGSPGISSTWAKGSKDFLGTANSDKSDVWFTGADGIITDVFYPSTDKNNVTDMQFLVGDKNHTWVAEEKKQKNKTITLVDKHSLAWKVVTTGDNGKWKLTKIIFTDPNRNSLVQRVTFTVLDGNIDDYNLYVLYNPAVGNAGDNNSGYTSTYNGRSMLVSTGNGCASAVSCSIPYVSGMVSTGYVGKTDGWTDLLGESNPDHIMNWTYDSASNGNIAQMGMIDLSSAAKSNSISFHEVLGFGKNANEAESTTNATLTDNIDNMQNSYISEWNNYCNSLDNQDGKADEQYYVSAMTLKTSQDKTSGAIVAGLGTPWGNSNGDSNPNGYHVTWPRDLYKFTSAMITAGDTDSANKALDFLLNKAQQPDGHFPQNCWTNGKPYWPGIQMDETADPILLAWKLGRTDINTYENHIKPAADYIVSNGPKTGQERWEENGGYSPATIASEIAGLVAAGTIANKNNDNLNAQRYFATADDWQQMVEEWTFTSTGSLGNGHYYERIDDDENPNDGHNITIGNGGGTYDERSIVDPSFLELVRLGVKSADDPYIEDSLPEIDSTIKENIKGKGDLWYRYNHDGYGEHEDGSNYDGTGKGRLWPIFTAERGEYAVEKGESAASYLNTLRSVSSSSYMIPEQVWDNSAPSGCTPGTATGSMSPLNWAMGDYMTLIASSNKGSIADMPSIVYNRYVKNAYKPDSSKEVDYDKSKLKKGHAITLYYKGYLAPNSSQLKVHYGFNGWTNINDVNMEKRSDGFWEASIMIPSNASQFDFVFTNGSNWDNNNQNDWHLVVNN
jgi:glucoamylase